MPHGYFWGGGMWVFPAIAMIIGITVMLSMLFLIFGRGFRPPWHDSGRHRDEGPESALDILKKRYAKGEISKEEFEQMKKDILS